MYVQICKTTSLNECTKIHLVRNTEILTHFSSAKSGLFPAPGLSHVHCPSLEHSDFEEPALHPQSKHTPVESFLYIEHGHTPHSPSS